MRSLLVAVLLITFLPSLSSAQWQSGGVPVSSESPGASQIGNALVSDGAGGVFVFWNYEWRYSSPTAPSALIGQHVDGNGNMSWGASGRAVTPDSVLGDGEDCVRPDGVTGFCLAWTRNNPRTGYVKRCTAEGDPRAGWPSGGVSIWPYGVDWLAVDTNGDLFVADYECVGACNSPPLDWNVYGQKVSPEGVVQWGAAGQLVAAPPGHQEAPKVLPDGQGNAYFTWDDLSGKRVVIQKLGTLGTPVWGGGGVTACDSMLGARFGTRLCLDRAGGVIVAWYDLRSGFYEVYAQRVSGVGARLWGANGLLLCSAAGDQERVAILDDGSGGAYFAWYDSRDSISANVYVQHVSAAGALMWGPSGRRIGTGGAYEGNDIRLAYGEAGKIYVAWDSPGGSVGQYRGFVQLVTTDGLVDPSWPPGGYLLGNGSGGQSRVRVVPDGAGGVFASWLDSRSGHDRTYLMRLAASGPVNVDESIRPGRGSLRVLRNPGMGSTSFLLALAAMDVVSGAIFDMTGRRIRTMQSTMPLHEGDYRYHWDGHDESGATAPSGVYVARFQGREWDKSVKFTFIR